MLRSTVAGPDTQPLGGVVVVVCRAVEDAGPLVAKLRRLGADPILVPLQRRVEAADGGVALRAALADLERYEWVAATSANGARSLLEALDGRAWPERVHVGAVGPATARAFTEAGVPVDLVASPSTAADLGRGFPAPAFVGRSRIMAPLAEAADDALTNLLEAKGYLVDRVDAYRTVEPRPEAGQRAEIARAHALVASAPSIVDRFIDRFSLAAVPPLVVSIGPRTTARCEARGIDRLVGAGSVTLVTAKSHDEPGLIEALVAAHSAKHPPSKPKTETVLPGPQPELRK